MSVLFAFLKIKTSCRNIVCADSFHLIFIWLRSLTLSLFFFLFFVHRVSIRASGGDGFNWCDIWLERQKKKKRKILVDENQEINHLAFDAMGHLKSVANGRWNNIKTITWLSLLHFFFLFLLLVLIPPCFPSLFYFYFICFGGPTCSHFAFTAKSYELSSNENSSDNLEFCSFSCYSSKKF